MVLNLRKLSDDRFLFAITQMLTFTLVKRRMKKLIVVFTLLMTAPLALFAQNVVSAEEQAAIKKLVLDESKAFYARDFEKWSNSYRIVPQTYLAFVDNGKSIQYESWDKIKVAMEHYFDNNPNPTKPSEVNREHYSFRKVNPTYIWLTFDQTKVIGGKKEFTKELRIVEMVKGEWKIVNRTGFVMQTNTSKVSEEVSTNKKVKASEEGKKETKKASEKGEEKPKKVTEKKKTMEKES